jgi:hypothetical protein
LQVVVISKWPSFRSTVCVWYEYLSSPAIPILMTSVSAKSS